jgi:enterobacterial common antigen flippase
MSTNSSSCTTVSNEATHSPVSDVGVIERLVGVIRKSVSRKMVGTVVTSFVLFGLMTVQGIILARMLGPEGRGQYGTAVFYTQTLMYIGLLGSHYAVARWAGRRASDLEGLWHSTSRLGILTGIGTMFVVAILAFWGLPPEKVHLAWLCILCSIYLPLEHIRLLWLAIDHGRGDFDRYNRSRLVAQIAFPALLAVAWISGSTTVKTVSLLFALAPLIGLTYQYLTKPNFTTNMASNRGPSVKRILQRGKPYAMSVLVSDLCDRIDMFLFLWLTSFTIQGYYAAAVPAANLLLVVPIALSLFAFNAGSHREQLTTHRSVWKHSAMILLVQFASAGIFALMLEPLMVLVYKEPFRAAVPLALRLLPAYAIAGCGRVAEAYLQGRNKAILGVYSRLTGAAAMCVFIYFGYSRWQEFSIPMGATVGYCVSSSMLLAAILLDVNRNPANRQATVEGPAT